MTEKKYIVLIVEDEGALRHALRFKIQDDSVMCLEAENGQQGLDVLKENTPNLIVLDLGMPVLDGFAMLEQLVANEDYSRIPVLVLTNYADADRVAEVLKYGINEYLVKSDWRIEDIVAKVRDKLMGVESAGAKKKNI